LNAVNIQKSVAKRLRCDEILTEHFVANLLLSVLVKGFRK